MRIRYLIIALALIPGGASAQKPRARDLGVPLDGTPGPLNAITDIPGVAVGYSTLISGEGRREVGRGPVRTGVTAILPRGQGNFAPVFAAFTIGNGNGDMTGTHWIDESGVLETPILITNTLSVGVVRDAVVSWMVSKGAAGPFWYPVVAETSDGRLNDQKGQHVKAADAIRALDAAKPGPVAEGNVGGGTGMLCNGFKGGTGTSSRQLAPNEGGFVVGALVQCNYGLRTELRISGIPVGREIQGYDPCVTRKVDPPVQFRGAEMPICSATGGSGGEEAEQGSIIVVIGTNAPLTPDQLRRVVRRVSLGMGRMGTRHGNGSGDIFIAFSTANQGADAGNSMPATSPVPVTRVPSGGMDPIFMATVEVTEEAIINAMIAAETMTGADYIRYYAIPHDQLQASLRKHALLTGGR
ncbi:MAG TPA: P1 family peptidase [Gemmatimonadales bacterium]|nr:P1 family peptidase [Gemmatimonadales bacterium]